MQKKQKESLKSVKPYLSLYPHVQCTPPYHFHGCTLCMSAQYAQLHFVQNGKVCTIISFYFMQYSYHLSVFINMCKYFLQPLYMYVKHSVSLCTHVYFSIHRCMSIQCVSMSIQWVSMSIQCVSMSIQCVSMSIQCVNMVIHCVSLYPCVSNQPSISIETNSTCAHCPSTYINTCARSIGMYQQCHPPPT